MTDAAPTHADQDAELREAWAYLTPHPTTNGPVVLDGPKMRGAITALRARIGELEKVLRDIAQQDRGGVQGILSDGGGDEEIICHLFRQIDRRRDLARAALSHLIPTTQTEEAGNG